MFVLHVSFPLASLLATRRRLFMGPYILALSFSGIAVAMAIAMKCDGDDALNRTEKNRTGLTIVLQLIREGSEVSRGVRPSIKARKASPGGVAWGYAHPRPKTRTPCTGIRITHVCICMPVPIPPRPVSLAVTEKKDVCPGREYGVAGLAGICSVLLCSVCVSRRRGLGRCGVEVRVLGSYVVAQSSGGMGMGWEVCRVGSWKTKVEECGEDGVGSGRGRRSAEKERGTRDEGYRLCSALL
jgi:hypothetical protein